MPRISSDFKELKVLSITRQKKIRKLQNPKPER